MLNHNTYIYLDVIHHSLRLVILYHKYDLAILDDPFLAAAILFLNNKDNISVPRPVNSPVQLMASKINSRNAMSSLVYTSTSAFTNFNSPFSTSSIRSKCSDFCNDVNNFVR